MTIRNTIYVVNNADGDSPGTVSVINGTTCNGADTTGCGRHFPDCGDRHITGPDRHRHPHRQPLHHRHLQRAGDRPEGSTLQRRSDQRLPHGDTRAGGRVTAGRPCHQPAHPHRLRDKPLPGRLHVNPQSHPPLASGRRSRTGTRPRPRRCQRLNGTGDRLWFGRAVGVRLTARRRTRGFVGPDSVPPGPASFLVRGAEDRRFELLRGFPQHAFQQCAPAFVTIRGRS